MSHAPQLVLIIDPDRDQQWFLAKALMPRFHVVGASSLAEANVCLMNERPTIILIEPDEPDGDGISWIRQLRASPRWQSLTIACVTQQSSFRAKVTGFHAGADDYIVKPVDISTFLTRISLLQQIRQLGLVLGRP
jgi:DNA-binding response OmpR family regulator